MDLTGIRAVSLDCAETLLKTRWVPGEFALDCAARAGLDLDGTPAREVYDRLLMGRWRDYEARNATRDPDQAVAWWAELTADWLQAIHLPREALPEVLKAADELLYDPEGTYFQPFEDVRPGLEAVRGLGLPMAVVSNWDYSLPRVLRVHGLDSYFQVVLASLVEGVEKPDARLFEIALALLGCEPHEVLHIGDNPVDDVQGARGAGLRALLIDRQAETDSPHVVRSLTEVAERLGQGV